MNIKAKTKRLLSLIIALTFFYSLMSTEAEGISALSKGIKNAYLQMIQLRSDFEDISEICDEMVDPESTFSDYYEAMDAYEKDEDNAYYGLVYVSPKYVSKQKTSARLGTPVDFEEYVTIGFLDSSNQRTAREYLCKGTLWFKKVAGEYIITKARRSIREIYDYRSELDSETVAMIEKQRDSFLGDETSGTEDTEEPKQDKPKEVEIILTSCPESSSSGKANISGSVSRDGDGFAKVFINGELIRVDAYYGSWSKEVTLKEGENVFEIKAVDSKGQTKTVTKKIVFQVEGPALTFKNCPEVSTNASVTISGALTDRNDRNPKLYINGDLISLDYYGSGWSKTVTLKEGENVFEFKASNNLGKTVTVTKRITFKIDGPNVVIKECPSTSNTNKVTISGSISDVNDTSPKIYLNGDLLSDYYGSWSKEVTLTEGENNFEIKGVNSAGKATVIKKTIIFKIGGPNLVILDCPENSTSAKVTIKGTASDENDSKLKVYLNGDLVDLYYGSWSKTITLKEGDNPIIIKATNRFGKETVITKNIHFGIEAPSIYLDKCPEKSSSAKVEISGRVSDENDTKPKVYLNGDLLDLYYGSWSKTVTLKEGDNVFEIKATNSFGKETVLTKHIFFGIEAPSIIIQSCPDVSTTKRITISGTVTDLNDSAPKVYLNEDQMSISWGREWSKTVDLIEGVNTFEIKATNSLGKTTTITKTVTYKIDPPNVFIDDCPARSSEKTITISGRVSDSNDAAPKLYINGELKSLEWGGSWSKVITLADGDNTIEIKAVNSYGKITVITKVITYGNEPPVLQILSLPPASDTEKVVISGTVFDKSDPTPKITINGEEVSVTGGAWSKELTLVPGENVVTIKASNSSGKVAVISKTIIYTPKPVVPVQ